MSTRRDRLSDEDLGSLLSQLASGTCDAKAADEIRSRFLSELTVRDHETPATTPRCTTAAASPSGDSYVSLRGVGRPDDGGVKHRSCVRVWPGGCPVPSPPLITKGRTSKRVNIDSVGKQRHQQNSADMSAEGGVVGIFSPRNTALRLGLTRVKDAPARASPRARGEMNTATAVGQKELGGSPRTARTTGRYKSEYESFVGELGQQGVQLRGGAMMSNPFVSARDLPSIGKYFGPLGGGGISPRGANGSSGAGQQPRPWTTAVREVLTHDNGILEASPRRLPRMEERGRNV